MEISATEINLNAPGTRQAGKSETKLYETSNSGLLQRVRHRVSRKQLAAFTRQLATLLEARLPLSRALEILHEQTGNESLRRVLSHVLYNIKEGTAFSTSLESYSRLFDQFYLSMVRVGERAGILEDTLTRLADHLEKMARLQRKILTAMTYPLVIVLVALGAMGFLLVVVVPTFSEMFRDFGGQLPGPTQLLFDLAHGLKANFIWLMAGTAGLVLLFFRLKRIEKVAAWLDRVVVRLPLIGTLLVKGFVARFSRTTGTLLTCGVKLVVALEVSAGLSTNRLLNASVIAMSERIIRGQSLMATDKDSRPFTRLTQQMIRVGEETGELDKMLLRVAQFYEEELDATIDGLTAIIEPVIIVFLGVVLGGALVAMYLQLFSLVDVIQ